MDITIKLLMSILVNQKLGITEANRLFNIIIQHYRYELTSSRAKIETVAMLIDCERLKLFGGRILCCNCADSIWAYNIETNKELSDEQLERVINLAFNEGAVRDYGN